MHPCKSKINYDQFCWGQNRLRRNQLQKTSRENLLFHKNRKKSKNRKIYQRSNDQLVERTSWIDHGIQLGRSPNWTTDSARPFAELDRRRAESTVIHLHLVLVTPLSRLFRTRSCFVSIGGIVGTLRFKNRKNSFSRITFGLIV